MGASRDEMAEEMVRLVGDSWYLSEWEAFMAGGEVWHRFVHGL